jgi:hypothetical protein
MKTGGVYYSPVSTCIYLVVSKDNDYVHLIDVDLSQKTINKRKWSAQGNARRLNWKPSDKHSFIEAIYTI